jgi:hypothetical protein
MIQRRPSLRSDTAFLNDIKVYYELAEIIPNTGHTSCGVTFEVSLVNSRTVRIVQQRGEIRISRCYNSVSKAYFGMHFSVRRSQSLLFKSVWVKIGDHNAPVCCMLLLQSL